MERLGRLFQSFKNPLPRIDVIQRIRPLTTRSSICLKPPLSRQIQGSQRRRIDDSGRITRRQRSPRSSSHPDRATLLNRFVERRANLNRNADKIRATEHTISQLERDIAVCHARANNVYSSQDQADTNDLRKELNELNVKLAGTQTVLSDAKREQKADIASQEADEATLLAAIERGAEDKEISLAAVEALRTVVSATPNIGSLIRQLPGLERRLQYAREKARQALRKARLEHFEHNEQDLNLQIASVKRSLSELYDRARNARIAMYSSLPEGLIKNDDLWTVYPSQEIADRAAVYHSIDEDYTQAHLELRKTRKSHDEYQLPYVAKLRTTFGHIPSNLSSALAMLESDDRVNFDAEWFNEWTEVIKDLEHVENVFIKRRNLAMKDGFQERQLYQNQGASDLPAFAWSCPSDGMTGSCAAQAIEESNQNFQYRKPFVEQWLQNVGRHEGVEHTNHAELNGSSIDSLVLPWDSMSSKDLRPRHRARIDKYNERWSNE